MVYKLLKKTITFRANLSDVEMKSFLVVLCKKNEESENYEFAAILNDIVNNYETVAEFTKPIKRTRKVSKTDQNKNG